MFHFGTCLPNSQIPLLVKDATQRVTSCSESHCCHPPLIHTLTFVSRVVTHTPLPPTLVKPFTASKHGRCLHHGSFSARTNWRTNTCDLELYRYCRAERYLFLSHASLCLREKRATLSPSHMHSPDTFPFQLFLTHPPSHLQTKQQPGLASVESNVSHPNG